MAMECAYCGSPDADTDDHIPARSIYTLPGPANPPKVRSCRACNHGASGDDEYFRDVVVRHRHISILPQAQRQLWAMFRAAGKPAKKPYARAILDSFVDTEVKTPAGLYLGHQPAYRVDAIRMTRIIRRYVRGLYCWEMGMRLPTSHVVEVIANPEHVNQAQADIERLFQGANYTTVQEGVFWYARQATSNPATMGWLLVFFEAMAFMPSRAIGNLPCRASPRRRQMGRRPSKRQRKSTHRKVERDYVRCLSRCLSSPVGREV
jgi:hypothetical protein